ncbi:hypothetical protein [Phormidium nigroviride]
MRILNSKADELCDRLALRRQPDLSPRLSGSNRFVDITCLPQRSQVSNRYY